MKTQKRKEYSLIDLMLQFIKDCKKGKRLQKNGKRLRKGSVENYDYLLKTLRNFSVLKEFPLRLRPVKRLTAREMKTERRYWRTFFTAYTNYLYNDLNCYDNYVSATIRLLRSFFNYLNDQKDLGIGSFHKEFYVQPEEIQIVVLTPERLNFLIENTDFHESLDPRLRRLKDIFVIGCTVALRFSDLMNIRKENLEFINDRVYLNIRSQKTQVFTRVKLPPYAVTIINKYWRGKKLVLPRISNYNMNKNVRRIVEAAGWTEPFIVTRQKRGVPQVIYKDPVKKTHFRFCDVVTTHTMRRTAITTMLCLGMGENLVRKISGHSAGSKEFFRYVSYAQAYMDVELDRMHAKLSEKRLENSPENVLENA